MADDVPLKKYVDRRFDDLDRYITSNRQNIADRFHSLNEIRGTLSDAQATFVTKTEYDSRHQPLEHRIQEMEVSVKDLLPRTEFAAYVLRQEENTKGLRRTQLNVVISIGTAFVSLIVAVLGATGHL